MPFLEWVCLDCGNAFDKPRDEVDGAATCPACGSAEVQAAKKTASSDSCTPRG